MLRLVFPAASPVTGVGDRSSHGVHHFLPRSRDVGLRESSVAGNQHIFCNGVHRRWTSASGVFCNGVPMTSGCHGTKMCPTQPSVSTHRLGRHFASVVPLFRLVFGVGWSPRGPFCSQWDVSGSFARMLPNIGLSCSQV